MVEEYWFKNRRIGIGWYPSNWKGWFTLFLYVISLISIAFLAKDSIISEDLVVRKFLAPTFALTFLLLIIVWRTGEPLDWHIYKNNKKE